MAGLFVRSAYEPENELVPAPMAVLAPAASLALSSALPVSVAPVRVSAVGETGTSTKSNPVPSPLTFGILPWPVSAE